jgi:uncharacterized RDD family membrane protein YckC
MAWIIDALLFAVVGYIVGQLLGQDTFSSKNGTVSYELSGGPFLLTSLVGMIYYVAMEGSKAGQTLGKKAMGIRVIDEKVGGPIGYGRAFVRWIGRVVSAIPLLLGYFWMIWDKNKQTWHDKFASAIVVPVDAYPVKPSS